MSWLSIGLTSLASIATILFTPIAYFAFLNWRRTLTVPSHLP